MHAWHRRKLSAHVDGALTGAARRRMEAHLAHCEACREELAELRDAVSLLRSLGPIEPPEFFATRVVARIEAGDAAPTFGDRLHDAARAVLASSWAPALGATALLVVAAVALRVQVHITMPGEPPIVAARSASALVPLPEPMASFSREITLVPTPVQSSRRFDPIVLDEASGAQRACAARPSDPECQGFRQKLVDLALANPPRFLRAVERVPVESQDRLIHAVSQEAVRAGHAERVIYRLRSVDDPRAVGIVVHFQRTIAARE
jgi:hypothetical protein